MMVGNMQLQPKPVDEIIEEVRMHLVPFISSLKDLISLSQTCRRLSIQLGNTNMTNIILNHNLAQQLARFNLTIENLHNVFRTNKGAVLSGSTVVQAFRSVQWANTDLDIYVPYREEVETFLKGALGSQEHNNNFHDVDDDDDDDEHTSYNNSDDTYSSTDEGDIFTFEVNNNTVKTIEGILNYFGLPLDGRYCQAQLIYSAYFPIHFKYMLELVQRSGKKIQLIFVSMDFYCYPEAKSCGFVVDFFDLSIVMNYYDGEHFRSRFPQHIFNKETTFNVGISSSINELQLRRLLKYVGRRGVQFLGPFLPLSISARQKYQRYKDNCLRHGFVLRFVYPAADVPVVQEEEPISSAERTDMIRKLQEPNVSLISGEWINAAVLADGHLFSDSDSDKDGEDMFRGFWRRQRRTALEYRKAGIPELEWEQKLQEKMPPKYSLHRRNHCACVDNNYEEIINKVPIVPLWSTNTMSLADAQLSVRFNMRDFPRNRRDATTIRDLYSNQYNDDDKMYPQEIETGASSNTSGGYDGDGDDDVDEEVALNCGN